MKRCTACQEDLPRSQYYGNGTPRGPATICKECAKKRGKEYRRARQQSTQSAKAPRKRKSDQAEGPSDDVGAEEAEADVDDDEADAAADAAATDAVRSHLDGITSTRAADTTGYPNDPYSLLKHGRLLTGEAAKKKMRTQLKPSDFLKEVLDGSRKFVVPYILSHFSRQLLAAKMDTDKRPLLHMNMGRPRVTYFKADHPLMQRVLNDMSTYIDQAVEKRAREAINFLQLLEDEASQSTR